MNACDASQQHHDRRKSKNHDQVINGNLCQCVRAIAIGEVAPNEDHRRARSSGENDQADDIVFSGFRIDPSEYIAEEGCDEKPTKSRHAEGLHDPIHKERDEQSSWLSENASDPTEVDLQHHGINHEPNENGDRDVHMGIRAEFPSPDAVRQIRVKATQSKADGHAGKYPNSQVAFKEIELFPFAGSSFGFHE